MSYGFKYFLYSKAGRFYIKNLPSVRNIVLMFFLAPTTPPLTPQQNENRLYGTKKVQDLVLPTTLSKFRTFLQHLYYLLFATAMVKTYFRFMHISKQGLLLKAMVYTYSEEIRLCSEKCTWQIPFLSAQHLTSLKKQTPVMIICGQCSYFFETCTWF